MDHQETAGLPAQAATFERKGLSDMKISNEQIKKIVSGHGATPPAELVDDTVIRLTDAELIAQIVQEVETAPDRDQMIADLKARIEAGTYNPTGDDIADAMIRRSIADRVR